VVATQSRERRRYRSSLRDAQARRTRQRVLAAATVVFLDRGYGATTIRAVAAEAKVSVPTVEALFGTKARLLKATIDVAIAGDDEPVAVLDRGWAADARQAGTAEEFLSRVAGVVAAAQARSAGLVLAVFEGSTKDRELEQVAEQMVAQRAVTASWIVDGVSRVASLREGCSNEEAIDTVWLFMDPGVFDRLTRRRNWTPEHYERWFARSVARLLTADAPRQANEPPARRSPRSTGRGKG
jgi:AcrR family transcriptional regulator